jgi:integrase
MATITKTTTSKGETRYRVRVVVGYRPDGTAIQRMRSFRTSKEANAWGRAQETAREQGTLATQAHTLTLGEYVGQWLTRSERRVRPITLAGYRYMLHRHVLTATIAQTRLVQLVPSILQTFIDGIARPANARRVRALLHIALNEAVKLGMLAINPVGRTSPPKHTPRPGQSWDADEARRFLAVAAHDSYAPYWQIALYLGMRPSEVEGLRWDSLDLEAGTLHVERARPTAMGRVFPSEDTKSGAGNRLVTLPPSLLAVLRAHRTAQLEQRLRAGPAWSDTGLVCASALGTPLDHANVRRHFVALREQACVPKIRVYDLRHSAISLMLDAGGDLKAVSEVVGHSNPGITIRVYRHVKHDQRAAAVQALAAALDPVPSADPE